MPVTGTLAPRDGWYVGFCDQPAQHPNRDRFLKDSPLMCCTVDTCNANEEGHADTGAVEWTFEKDMEAEEYTDLINDRAKRYKRLLRLKNWATSWQTHLAKQALAAGQASHQKLMADLLAHVERTK